MILSSELSIFGLKVSKAPVAKAAFAGVLVGTIFLTSACGSSNADTAGVNSVAPSVSSALPVTAGDPTAVAPPVDNSTLAGNVIDGIPTKEELGRNSKGEYIQNTTHPSDPAFNYNQAIVDQSASQYSPEEITEVQAMIVNFISEETIGSSLNGSVVPPDFEAWFERNKDKFEPKEHSGFLSSLRSRDTTVMIVFLPYFRAGKYDLRYGKDATHVLSQTISPTGVYGGELGGKQAMKIEATVGFDLAALVDGEVRKETTTGTVGYSVLKDPDTGKWLISGFTNTFFDYTAEVAFGFFVARGWPSTSRGS